MPVEPRSQQQLIGNALLDCNRRLRSLISAVTRGLPIGLDLQRRNKHNPPEAPGQDRFAGKFRFSALAYPEMARTAFVLADTAAIQGIISDIGQSLKRTKK